MLQTIGGDSSTGNTRLSRKTSTFTKRNQTVVRLEETHIVQVSKETETIWQTGNDTTTSINSGWITETGEEKKKMKTKAGSKTGRNARREQIQIQVK